MKRVVLMTKFLRQLRPESIDGAELRPSRTPWRISDIPREFLLQDLKEKREFRRLARKLGAFLAFLMIYMSVLLIDRDISRRSELREALSNELLGRSRAPSGIKFADISDTSELWDWLTNSFFVSVYSNTDPDGLPRSLEDLYAIASRSKIIGGFHVLQNRYSVVDTSAMEFAESPCFSGFLPTRHELCIAGDVAPTSPFGTTDGTPASEAELQTLDMFRFSTNKDFVGGYQTLFLRSSTNGTDELAKLSKMQSYRWIDHYTKSVEITMSLYNFDLRLCSVVNYRVDFTLAGLVVPSSAIYVTNMEPYNMKIQTNLVRVVYEALYVLLLLYFVLLELWNICVVSRGSIRKYVFYYGKLEILGEWIMLLNNLGILFTRWLMATNAKQDEFFNLSSMDEYISLLQQAQSDNIFVTLNIFNMFLITARAIKYFKVTDGGRRLTNSVFSAMPDILSFLPIYLTVLLGYTCAGYLLYGLSFHEWSTFTGAFFRVFEMNFGLYDPAPIYDSGGIFGMVYICSASVVFCIIMLNVFMAIVMSTWEYLTEKEREKSKKRRQFREKMSFGETMALVFMNKATLDTLINVVLKLNDHETINRHVFERAWKTEQKKNVPKIIRDHILQWYWLPIDLDHKEMRSPQAAEHHQATDQEQHAEASASSSSSSPAFGPTTEDLLGKNSVMQLSNLRQHSGTRVVPT